MILQILYFRRFYSLEHLCRVLFLINLGITMVTFKILFMFLYDYGRGRGELKILYETWLLFPSLNTYISIYYRKYLAYQV